MSTAGCGFTYRHYAETLSAHKEAGCTFSTFSECKHAALTSPSSVFLLRHDVDKSVKKAVDLARIEHELGIRATYFIRIHSNYYNPFGHVVYRQLREIGRLGHEIGLHTEFYDAAQISGEDAVEMFGREATVLESITKSKCGVYSLHRTSGSSTIEEIQRKVPVIREKFGIVGAYDLEFQNGFKYLSDSSGIWREGCFCGHLKRHEKLHVLIHPDWWFGEHIELEEPLV